MPSIETCSNGVALPCIDSPALVAARNFIQQNKSVFLTISELKETESAFDVIFTIDEDTLKNVGLRLYTNIYSGARTFWSREAAVTAASNTKPGFNYFSAQLELEINDQLNAASDNGLLSAQVKINLANYDAITGLLGVYKNLYVRLSFSKC
jgi:hypothetical protein